MTRKVKCPECNGRGVVYEPVRWIIVTKICKRCNGRGWIHVP